MKFDQFMSYYKIKKFINYKNCDLNTSSRPLVLCLQRIKHNFYWKIKFWKQVTYNRYVLAQLSKIVQIKTLFFSDSFLQRIPWKWKRVNTNNSQKRVILPTNNELRVMKHQIITMFCLLCCLDNLKFFTRNQSHKWGSKWSFQLTNISIS